MLQIFQGFFLGIIFSKEASLFNGVDSDGFDFIFKRSGGAPWGALVLMAGGGGAFKKDCRLEGEGSSISLTPTMGNLVYMSNYGQNF